MPGINKVILVGNLGQDPELRYTANGNPIANFSIATSEVWKDKNTGQNQERTEWHRILVFGKAAENAAEYLRKGSKVYIEGMLNTRKWQDQAGIDRYTTEIKAHTVQYLDTRNNNQAEGQGRQSGNQEPHQGQHYRGGNNQSYDYQSPQNNNQNQQNNGHSRANNAYQNAKQGGKNQGTNHQAHQNPPQGFNEFDDDIPF